MKFLASVLACLSLAAVPRATHAAGFFMPFRGVRATSNAGAFVAGTDDMWALWYNPANLVDGSSLRAMVDTAAVFFASSFKRLETGLTAHNQAGPLAVPSFGLAGNLGGPRFPIIAIGFTAPYAGALTYNEGSPARYSLVDASGTMLAFVHLAVAHEIIPGLKVGAGIQNVVAKIRQVRAASAYTGLFGQPEDQDLDLPSEVQARDLLSITGNAGVTWAPVPTSLLALSVQLPYHFNGSGTMRLRMPGSYFFDATSVSGERADIKLRFPPVVRLAYRHRFKQLWEVEVALVYEAWSYHRDIRIIPRDLVLHDIPGLGSYKLREIIITHDYQDSLSVRVGGSWHVNDQLEARAGLSYESPAIPRQRLDASRPDSNKIGLGLGVSYTWKLLRFDAAYGYLFYAWRKVADSKVTQVNPINPYGALVVGNGTYRGDAHIIGAAVSLAL